MQIINNTGSNFVIQGVTIANTATYTITVGEERVFAADQTLWIGLLNPLLSVGDGTNNFIDGPARDFLLRTLEDDNLDKTPASQNITTRDIASSTTSGQNSQSIITGMPTVNSAASFAFSSFNTGLIQVSGTWTGTLQSEISFDSGTTWYPIKISQPAILTSITTFTNNLSATTNISGATNFRIRATAAMTGTVVINLILSYNEYVPNDTTASTVAGILTDRSGIATATSAQLMPANNNRKYLFIQNIGNAPIYINFTSAATVGSGSIELAQFASFAMEGAFVSTEQINVIRSGGSNMIFTAKEG